MASALLKPHVRDEVAETRAPVAIAATVATEKPHLKNQKKLVQAAEALQLAFPSDDAGRRRLRGQWAKVANFVTTRDLIANRLVLSFFDAFWVSTLKLQITNKQLVAETDVSESTVKEGIERLEAYGLIQRMSKAHYASQGKFSGSDRQFALTIPRQNVEKIKHLIDEEFLAAALLQADETEGQIVWPSEQTDSQSVYPSDSQTVWPSDSQSVWLGGSQSVYPSSPCSLEDTLKSPGRAEARRISDIEFEELIMKGMSQSIDAYEKWRKPEETVFETAMRTTRASARLAFNTRFEATPMGPRFDTISPEERDHLLMIAEGVARKRFGTAEVDEWGDPIPQPGGAA